MSEAARSRRDDGRYEPHVAVPGREAAPFDPLAELARLVGQDDPFRNVFRPAAQGLRTADRSPQAEPEPRHAGHGGVSGRTAQDAAWDHGPNHHENQTQDHAHATGEHGDEGAHADHRHDGDHDADGHHHHGGYHDADGHDGYDDAHAHQGQGGYDGAHLQYGHGGYHTAAQPVHDEAGFADEHLAPLAAPSPLPDVWARGDAGLAPDVDHGPGPMSVDRPRSAARRPVAVLAAVLLLTAGGLGASFIAKGGSAPGSAAVGSGRGAPTIMAASGPTKVKVDDGSATAPEDQDAELLNKSANLPSGPVKIVSSQEQPADLAQLPRADLADGARPLPPPSPSPFPEPKRVKTFVVHPDGSMLSGDAAPVTSSVAAPAPSTGGDVTAALPATPKTVARGGATPRVAAAAPAPEPSIASLSGDPALTDPAAVATSPAKPSRAASGGSYGVQLASSPVEADANAAFTRLKKKYPAQLGSLTATVHKAETGDKPVYRVRVGGMSQEEAKALCNQLQTAGGACLVMHN